MMLNRRMLRRFSRTAHNNILAALFLSDCSMLLECMGDVEEEEEEEEEDVDLTEGDLVEMDLRLRNIKPKSVHWWNQLSTLLTTKEYVFRDEDPDRDDPQRFRERFRVSVPTFEYICDLVAPDLECNSPIGLRNIDERSKIEVHKQVGIALRRLATGDSLQTVGEMFGVSRSIAGKAVYRFAESLLKRGKDHLKWPDQEQLTRIKAKFENLHGIPQVCGAIDCTHIEIGLPAHKRDSNYCDLDKGHTLILQAIVDPDTRFLNVCAGVSGVVPDATVFNNSVFKSSVDRGKRLNGPPVVIQGVSIPEMIIGDAGYTQSKCMLTPLPRNNNNTPLSNDYNRKHSGTRMCVDNSFAILKGVWRILRTLKNPDIRKVPRLMYVCCLLHNIMLDRGDVIDDEVPLVGHHDEDYRAQLSRERVLTEADAIRGAIVQHLHLRD